MCSYDRHPIYEITNESFVSNDIDVCTQIDDKRVLVVSGANFSGKSVYLKQVQSYADYLDCIDYLYGTYRVVTSISYNI